MHKNRRLDNWSSCPASLVRITSVLHQAGQEKSRLLAYLVLWMEKDVVRDKQMLVPKLLREKVIEVAPNYLFGENLGVRKTKDKIQTKLFWQGLCKDVTNF